ncbi:MAG: hypothetical protein IJJ43_05150 [Oscillospiraceae bacterium]|nr:hypothetical protein [Oscillospiraceae bacterium]
MKRGKTAPGLWLLLIPAKLALDLLVLRAVAAWEIAAKPPGTPGHPSGMLTFGAGLLASALTVVVIVIAVVLWRRGVKRRRAREEQPREERAAWDPER